MDKELKAKWLEALRSGKYEQQRYGLLHHIDDNGKDSFCCLGVLCKVAGVCSRVVPRNSAHNESHVCYNGTHGYLSDSMRIKIGMSDYQMKHLVNMNDNLHNNFNEIADWIEESL